MQAYATSKLFLSLENDYHLSSVIKTNSQNRLCRVLFIIFIVLVVILATLDRLSVIGKNMTIFAPMQHVRRTCSHESPTIGRQDFKIIGRDSNPFLVKLKESIFINKLSPELNGRETSVPLYLFKQ